MWAVSLWPKTTWRPIQEFLRRCEPFFHPVMTQMWSLISRRHVYQINFLNFPSNAAWDSRDFDRCCIKKFVYQGFIAESSADSHPWRAGPRNNMIISKILPNQGNLRKVFGNFYYNCCEIRRLDSSYKRFRYCGRDLWNIALISKSSIWERSYTLVLFSLFLNMDFEYRVHRVQSI